MTSDIGTMHFMVSHRVQIYDRSCACLLHKEQSVRSNLLELSLLSEGEPCEDTIQTCDFISFRRHHNYLCLSCRGKVCSNVPVYRCRLLQVTHGTVGTNDALQWLLGPNRPYSVLIKMGMFLMAQLSLSRFLEKAPLTGWMMS